MFWIGHFLAHIITLYPTPNFQTNYFHVEDGYLLLEGKEPIGYGTLKGHSTQEEAALDCSHEDNCFGLSIVNTPKGPEIVSLTFPVLLRQGEAYILKKRNISGNTVK